MIERRIPAALLSAIKQDFKPVTPLASPGRRALALVPLGIVLLVGLPVFWAWREHISGLAPLSSWGLSPLETAAGLLALAAAFREAVPGRALSAKALVALIGLAAAVFVMINLTDPPQMPVIATVETRLRWLWECIGMATAFSAPALAVPTWLAWRALPNRPALTGALCGLGVGLMADAGLRLFCWDSETSHVLIAHGGAIVILVALGALSAVIVERLQLRSRAHIR